MRKSWLKAWALALGLAGLCAGMAARAEERIDIDANDPPFMYADANGGAAGFYPEMLRLAFALMNEPVKIDAVPWKRAVAEIDAGTAGVAGIYKNQERLQKYDFSATLLTEKLVVVTRRDRGLRFAGMEDLAGLHLGVIRGWSYGDEFDSMRTAGRFQVEEVVGDATNFTKLEAGRLDAVISIEQSSRKLLAAGGFPSLHVLPVPMAMKTAHLAFNRSQHKGALLARFDAAIETLRRSGEMDRLIDRHLSSP